MTVLPQPRVEPNLHPRRVGANVTNQTAGLGAERRATIVGVLELTEMNKGTAARSVGGLFRPSTGADWSVPVIDLSVWLRRRERLGS